MAENIGITILILAFFALFFLLCLAATSKNRGQAFGGNSNPGVFFQSPLTSPPPLGPNIGPSSFNSEFITQQITILYHGTKFENAIEIHNTGLWLIGYAWPPAVWMTDNIEIAKSYSGSNGAIVQIQVDAGIKLTKQGDGVYIFTIPDAAAHKDYYRIEGITPIGVLSPQGYLVQ